VKGYHATMSRLHVVQVSDTHLSPTRPWIDANFDAITGIVSAVRPDLVVNTGDIAFDGDLESDLAFARARHAALGCAVRAIPGNHDVGDNPWRAQSEPHSITALRLERYRRHFDQDYWRLEAGRWLLIGLNVQLFGSGLVAEAEQWAFVAAAATLTGSRPVALFVHKPLFEENPGETDVNHRFVPPEHRHRLLALLGAGLRLVASGHVHQHRYRRVGAVDHWWAPSTAFVFSDHRQPRLGTKRVGYVDFAFEGDEVAVRIVEPLELTNHDVEDFEPLRA
jgi:3',5'-cyclic AMP phosphodiesterase CpdA